jgi:ribosome biogenesis GTPase A
VFRILACGSPLLLESRRLGILRKVGGKFLPNLNMTQRPIAKKYCEGKLKRISKEKLKVHETISREQISGF